MSTALALLPPLDLAALTCSNLPSPHTRRAYERHIRDYLSSGLPLSRDGVSTYIQHLRDQGISPPSITQALAAIRKLADEARSRGVISELETWSISQLKVKSSTGVRAGMWLQSHQIKTLYALPDRNTVQGKRDAALMGLLIGCGLRRSEAAEITWDHYDEREGRMALIDFRGKGDKIRTVGVSRGVQRDIDAWYEVLASHGCADAGEPILRRIRLGSDDYTQPLSDAGIWHVVRLYAQSMGLDFSPHDLRRSMAKLMHKRGVELTQIQLILGHADLITTKRYLGLDLELAPGLAGTDAIDIDLSEAERFREED